jgi:hypothetical protein
VRQALSLVQIHHRTVELVLRPRERRRNRAVSAQYLSTEVLIFDASAAICSPELPLAQETGGRS